MNYREPGPAWNPGLAKNTVRIACTKLIFQFAFKIPKLEKRTVIFNL